MKCDRPGCTGTIEEDGYCDVCGHKLGGARKMATAGALASTGSEAAVARPVTTAAPSVSQANGAATSATGTSLLTTVGSGVVGRSRSTTQPTMRGGLGAGLVEVPPVEARDPGSFVMVDPHVLESKRYCANCERPVGRSRNGRAGIPDGFCSSCGHPYSFTPKLAAGDLVAGQYEVAGCLAHGGMGWVYLARDHALEDRWVVLKGLLDTGDEGAVAAAVAERSFLAKVKHPNIVEIHNSVEHHGNGYIVMEYAGGKSLKELRRNESGGSAPMPVAQGIAYILAALPALEYLHGRGLLYCDFKPENVIHTEQGVKIIDLGGVRRIDDDSSDLYGTPGYQAPEVRHHGPSIASDLYTVARTLAVLIFDFRGYQDPQRYLHSLPPEADVPVFRRYPGLYRFLLRGTHPDPSRRFQSAGEAAEQLVGVLRQVVAMDGGAPESAPSRLFTPELAVDTERPTWRNLPVPAMDRDDPSAGVLVSLAAAPPAQLLAALEAAPASPDVSFQRARAYLELGDWQNAADALVAEVTANGESWRVWWWEGIVSLVDSDCRSASGAFESVAAELPGELAPILAMATARERGGDHAGAEALYDLVSATDAGYATAAFGLARARRTGRDRPGAAAALHRVPAKSSAYQAAQVALCAVCSEDGSAGEANFSDLVLASDALERITGDPVVRAALTRDILTSALAAIKRGASPDREIRLAGVEVDEDSIRLALERVCRTLAKLSPTDVERIALVDQANVYRPRTWL